MFLSAYRSLAFEKNSKLQYAEYGTFMLSVDPDCRNSSAAIDEVWSYNAFGPNKVQSSDAALMSYQGWKRVICFDIGKKSLFLAGHSEFFNTFDTSSLAREIIYNHQKGLLRNKSRDKCNQTLMDRLNCAFRLDKDDVDNISEAYLFPESHLKLIDAQQAMTDTISRRLSNILIRLEYRCVICA